MKPYFFVKVIGTSAKVYKTSIFGDRYIASFAFTNDATEYANFKNSTYNEDSD